MAQAMSLGLDHQIEIATPFHAWGKEDVIRRGVELAVPFDLTLSCMNPITSASGASGASSALPSTADSAASAATGVMPSRPQAS
jgi:7-cyano-7-deazaguanine synthase in queuosine biosynthesis